MREAVADPQHAYRRAARRLRGLHAGRPAALYRSLRDLSDRYDQAFPGQTDRNAFGHSDSRASTGQRMTRSRLHGSAPAERFGRRVVARLENGVLRYSARAQLLAAAEEMGIDRFQANLIIAVVQNQAEPTMREPRLPRRVIPPVSWTVVILIQLVIALLAWGIWYR